MKVSVGNECISKVTCCGLIGLATSDKLLSYISGRFN